MLEDAKPEDFFQIFLNDNILDVMGTETNEYAGDIMNRSRPSWCKSQMNSCYDNTLNEMRKFIGLILHMGIIKVPFFKSVTDFK